MLQNGEICGNMKENMCAGDYEMRLYSMYYVCKQYINMVKDMKVEERKDVNGNRYRCINNWLNKSKVINELAKVYPLRDITRKLYETIPTVYCDKNNFDVSEDIISKFIAARKELIVAMETVIAVYEMANTKVMEDISGGFDIKLPHFNDVGEFSKCLNDLDFIIKQCPYLKDKDEQIKYGSVDIGSTWLTFLIVGVSTGCILLNNISKIVDKAIKIKSHVVTVKAQEEALRSLQIRNEVSGEVLSIFKQANKAIVDQCVDELQNELGKLSDGEEKDKVGKSLEKLAYWMDKGMQIYSTIEAPAEVKDLFPEQEDLSFLTDDIQKLLEMKVDK